MTYNIAEQRLTSAITSDPAIFAYMILEARGDMTVFYEGYIEELSRVKPVPLADPD